MVKAYRPLTLGEALEIRGLNDTVVVAGGSDLMVRYKAWGGTAPDFPKDVLFVGHLKELNGISSSNNVIQIGAAVTFSQILQDKRIPECIKLPVSQIGSPSIRNLGTIGGNICNSSPAGDTLPVLYALDAELTVKSKSKTYTTGISEFITGPGKNILKHDEILKYINIPIKNFNRVYYKKVGQRTANSVSKVSFFALANTGASEIYEARMAFGAVSPTVIRSLQAESFLKSIRKTGVSGIIDEVKDRYKKLINPIDDVRSTKEYRKKVAMRILEHFLLEELGK